MRKLLILFALIFIGLQSQIATASTTYNVPIYIEGDSNVIQQITVMYNQKGYAYSIPSFQQNTRTYLGTANNVSVPKNGTTIYFISDLGLMCDVIIRNGNPVLLTMTGYSNCTAVQGVL
ncbi:MAG: hypothetical protein JSR85_03780 [Proteobacteria bacterium]|nr:hypothetical protein [Pseudomonadota bacterium]